MGGARKSRLIDYQNECNVRGLITTNQVSHSFRPEPCLNTHPPRSKLADGKPLEMVMKNPLIQHDTYVTTNNLYHGRKFYEREYAQPQHLLPAVLTRVHYIKPDFHRKIAKGDFNPNPVYHLSEMHDEFKSKHRNHDIYGPPSLHIPHRDVYLPMSKDFVFTFDRDSPYSILRMSHPYLSTTQMTHRQFSPEEYEQARETVALKGVPHIIGTRLVNDIVVAPMEDVLEQRVKAQVNLDYLKDFPSASANDAGRKSFFRRSLYKGCPPRVFPPVEHYGMSTTTESTYSHPISAQDKNNFTGPVKAKYIQPKASALAVATVPAMYRTESMGYGSGRHVATVVKLGQPDICGSVCVP